jgi:hypothetical protein
MKHHLFAQVSHGLLNDIQGHHEFLCSQLLAEMLFHESPDRCQQLVACVLCVCVANQCKKMTLDNEQIKVTPDNIEK